jgi:hypothetical protein
MNATFYEAVNIQSSISSLVVNYVLFVANKMLSQLSVE